ncbi:MAG: hypothetical protein FWF53_05655 [Candidatus Azobacteroides sp.]|nr:hypothetical protein [Candidatus Azobacteroides sp.]
MDNTNDINRLDERLELMIGKTYKHNGGIIKVNDVKIRGNIARIITDGAPVCINTDDLDNELKAFKQISDNMLARDTRIVDSVMYENNVYSVIQNTLLDSIEKIKSDKDYIQQAQAVNDTVKNLIELEKTRISVLALLKQ